MFPRSLYRLGGGHLGGSKALKQLFRVYLEPQDRPEFGKNEMSDQIPPSPSTEEAVECAFCVRARTQLQES